MLLLLGFAIALVVTFYLAFVFSGNWKHET